MVVVTSVHRYTVVTSAPDHGASRDADLSDPSAAAPDVVLFNGAPVYRLDGTAASFLFLYHDGDDHAVGKYSWRIAPALGGLSYWAEFVVRSDTETSSASQRKPPSQGMYDESLRANADGCTAQRGQWMCWTGAGAFAADETMTVEPCPINEDEVSRGPSLNVCDASTRAAVLKLGIMALLRDHGFSGCDLGLLRKYIAFMHRCHTCTGRRVRERDDDAGDEADSADGDAENNSSACCAWHKCLDQCILAEMLARCFRERVHRCMKAVLTAALSQGADAVADTEESTAADLTSKEERTQDTFRERSDATLEFRAALSANIQTLLGNPRDAHLLQLGVSATGESVEPFWQCQSKAWLLSK